MKTLLSIYFDFNVASYGGGLADAIAADLPQSIQFAPPVVVLYTKGNLRKLAIAIHLTDARFIESAKEATVQAIAARTGFTNERVRQAFTANAGIGNDIPSVRIASAPSEWAGALTAPDNSWTESYRATGTYSGGPCAGGNCPSGGSKAAWVIPLVLLGGVGLWFARGALAEEKVENPRRKRRRAKVRLQ